MNLRRLMGALKLRPHITTLLGENIAVHHSKIDRRIAEMGHSRQIGRLRRSRLVASLPKQACARLPRYVPSVPTPGTAASFTFTGGQGPKHPQPAPPRVTGKWAPTPRLP